MRQNLKSLFSIALYFCGAASIADTAIARPQASDIPKSVKSSDSFVEEDKIYSLRELFDPDSTFFDRIQWRAQGQMQGAGTPNRVAIGAFSPLSVSDRWLPYLDFELGVNLADREGLSSIVNTKVSGPTLSTSTRLGIRRFFPKSKWMLGLNVGYDSRPIDSGDTTEGFDLNQSQRNVFFQQLAAQIDIASDSLLLRPYILYPIGETEQRLNRFFMAGALQTYGVDLTHQFNDYISGTVGYYYQQGDLGTANGSGIASRIDVEVLDGFYLNATYTYDPRFESRLSGGFKYVFNEVDTQRSSLAYRSMLEPPTQREVRVHDSWKQLIEKKMANEESHPWLANSNSMTAFIQNNCVILKETKQPLCRLLIEDVNGSKKYHYFWGESLVALYAYMAASPDQENIDALIAGKGRETLVTFWGESTLNYSVGEGNTQLMFPVSGVPKCVPLKSYNYACSDAKQLDQLFPHQIPLDLTAAQEFNLIYQKLTNFVMQNAAQVGLDYVSNGVLTPHGLIKYGWKGVENSYQYVKDRLTSSELSAEKEEMLEAVQSAEKAVAEQAADEAAAEAAAEATLEVEEALVLFLE